MLSNASLHIIQLSRLRLAGLLDLASLKRAS